jgi:hypothetical protein
MFVLNTTLYTIYLEYRIEEMLFEGKEKRSEREEA